MIQIQQSPQLPAAYPNHDSTDIPEGAAPAESPAVPEESAAGADPLARFGALHGFHPAIPQSAYATPNSAGSGNAPNTSASTRSPSSRPANNATVPAPSAELKQAQAEAQALMDRGVQLLNQHKYDEALAAFQEGFRTYPDRGFLLNEASTLFDAGRYGEATLAYQQYLSDPDAPRADEVRAMLGRIEATTGGTEITATGIAEGQKAFEAGVKAYDAGRYDEAYQAFDRAFELNPTAQAKFNAAASLEKLGSHYAAAERYDSYVAMAKFAPDAGKAADHAAKLRAEAPNVPITAAGHAGAMEWIARGNELLFAHKYDAAVEAYREGFRTYPDRAFILNEASALLDGGRYAEADLAYGRYLSEPGAPRADEAVAAQQRARAAMGGREATATGIAESGKYFDQGVEHYKAGRYSEALKKFDRAYELNPNSVVRFNRAACLDRLGLREQAIEQYKSYLKLDPNASDASKVQDRIGKLQKQVDSLSQEAFDRGQQAYLDHRYRDAGVAFGEAYGIKSDPSFLFDKAAALDKAGDTEQAVRGYQEYLRAAPNAPDADKVRARIVELNDATGNGLMKP